MGLTSFFFYNRLTLKLKLTSHDTKTPSTVSDVYEFRFLIQMVAAYPMQINDKLNATQVILKNKFYVMRRP